MTGVGESGSGGGGRDSWQGRKSRDDTPSFIRDVQARAEMLHPNRNTEEHIPVLTMPQSVRIWRRIRWPLFVGIVAVALGALALFTHDRLQARSIEKRIAEAHEAELSGTVRGLLEAEQILSLLVDRHPDRVGAQAAWAWQAVLLGELFGPREQYLARARAALERTGADRSGPAAAARAGEKALSGDAAGALESVLEGLKAHPKEPRLLLARCIALRSAGRLGDAASALAELSASHPDYLPARHLAIIVAIEARDRETTRSLAVDLLGRSPGHMVASLGLMISGLPGWGEDDPSAEDIARMERDVHALAGGIAQAPPAVAALGQLLTGRVALLSGKPQDAVAAFGKAFADDEPSPIDLAWYALAVREAQGVDAALALLDEHRGVIGPEVHATRVRCLLDGYRVGAAREAFATLEQTGALPEVAAELGWMLAVRAGERAAALAALPPRLGAAHWKPALELYEQARSSGDLAGVEAVIASTSEGLGPCSAAIRAWHGANVKAALAALGKSEDGPPCLDALAARFLLGHADPATVQAAAVRAVRAGGGDPMLEISRARATWLVEGQAAAATILGAVREFGGDALPLKTALAEAYLDIGLAAEGLAALDGLDAAPEVRALRMRALAALGRKDEFQAAIGEIADGGGEPLHPALLTFVLERDLEAGALDRIAEKAPAALSTAGRWTADIAEIHARALNNIGERSEADRTLETAAREGRKAAGQGEGWEARLAQIRMNLRRGATFLYRAQNVILDLSNAGLKDAELSYSLAVTNIRQGNERGAVRFLRDAIQLDPSFVPAYSQLAALGKLSEDERAGLERTRPGATP